MGVILVTHLFVLMTSLQGLDAWRRPLINSSPTRQCLWKLAEFAAIVHTHDKKIQDRTRSDLAYLLLLHLAWIWVTVYVEMNADTAHDILLGRAVSG